MRLAVGALALLLASGCGIPRDPEGTLQRVTGGTMRVGIAEHEPWVLVDESGHPEGGVEVALVEEFAATLDADIEWVAASTAEIAAALHTRSLDLGIAGFASTSPFQKEATFTHPYLTTFTTIGIPPGRRTGSDLSGEEVVVEMGTELEGIVRKLDVVVDRVDDISVAEGLVATHDWLLDDLGLDASDVRLTETDHVMAIPHGENAWLTSLERFLLENGDRALELLDMVEA